MHMFFSTLIYLLAMAPSACTQDASKVAEPPEQLLLQSHYLVEPLQVPKAGRGHRVFLTVSLTGEMKGQLMLDPNRCQLDPFGDPGACTEMAAMPIDVTLKQAKLADPKKTGRRLFLLDGVPGDHKLNLVVPREGEPGFRLVASNAADKITHVLPLHRVRIPVSSGKK